MKVFLVTSVRPNGQKALVGHIREFDGDSWRSEVYDTLEDATAMRNSMEDSFANRGMKYEVHEINV